MTDKELQALYAERSRALKALSFGGYLCGMPREKRLVVDSESRAFRRADRAIVAELLRRKRPAVLGKITLVLTSDKLNFAVTDTADGGLSVSNDYEKFRSNTYFLDYEVAFGSDSPEGIMTVMERTLSLPFADDAPATVDACGNCGKPLVGQRYSGIWYEIPGSICGPCYNRKCRNRPTGLPCDLCEAEGTIGQHPATAYGISGRICPGCLEELRAERRREARKRQQLANPPAVRCNDDRPQAPRPQAERHSHEQAMAIAREIRLAAMFRGKDPDYRVDRRGYEFIGNAPVKDYGRIR